MSSQRFSKAELSQYEADGYFLAKNLFHRDEIDKLLSFAQNDPAFRQSLYGRKDATGMETKLALWNDAGNVILWFLLSVLAWFVGALLCGLGLIVAIPVVLIGTAYTYKTLNNEPVAA